MAISKIRQMILYLALLILLALLTGICLLRYGKKEGNMTKRTLGIILIILSSLIILFCTVMFILLYFFWRMPAIPVPVQP